LFIRIWQRSWLDRVVSHRRPAVTVVAVPPNVDHPPGGGPLTGGPPDPSITSCDHFVELG
jgi:hypothetical protein